MIGKQQKPISIQAVHKIWHLIVGGIEKIDYRADAHLQKVMCDLVVKWIPQFKTMNSQKIVSKPFINCIHQSQSSTIQFIFDKIVTNFLTSQRRESHQNATIAMTIMMDVIANFSHDPERVKTVLQATCFQLLEHAMMIDDSVPSKMMVYDFFTGLFRSAAFISNAEIR